MKKFLRKGLAVLLAAAAAMACMVPSLADDSTATVNYDVTYGQTEAREMFDMVNDLRTGDNAWYWNESNTEKVYVNNGTLQYDYQLEKIAMQRAAELAISYAHKRPNGESWYTLYEAAGYTSGAAENICAGQSTVEEAFNAWLEQNEDYSGQGHRRAMLGKYASIGIGHVEHDGRHYWAMEISDENSGTAETTANNSVTTVQTTITTDQIAGISAVGSVEVLVGDSTSVSTATLNVRLNNTWPSSKTFNITVPMQWASANTNIATVSGGTVTGVSAGSTTLTANFLGRTISIPITVNSKSSTPSDGNEQVTNFVYRLYEITLGRTPSKAEAQDWVNRLLAGTHTGAEVVSGFVFSPEYTRKNTSDSDYVDMLYHALFDRNPDASGKKTWMDSLDNGMTRGYVLAGFTGSAEFNRLCNAYGIRVGSWTSNDVRDQNPNITTFVTRLYRTCLNRNPDEGGLIDWVTLLANNSRSGSQVVQGFVFSAEMNRKQLSNEEYVNTLYKALFDRSPDAEGKQTWMGCLNSGWSREQVLGGFTGSAEFNRLCSRYGIRV